MPPSSSRPRFEREGLTVQEATLLCFRSRWTINRLINAHDLPVKIAWVAVRGAAPLLRPIRVLPPATVQRLLSLTCYRPR